MRRNSITLIIELVERVLKLPFKIIEINLLLSTPVYSFMLDQKLKLPSIHRLPTLLKTLWVKVFNTFFVCIVFLSYVNYHECVLWVQGLFLEKLEYQREFANDIGKDVRCLPIKALFHFEWTNLKPSASKIW